MIPSAKGAVEMGYSDHEAASEAQLSEQLAIAVGQARQHANAGAAKLLIEAGDPAHQHIDKPSNFDEVVNECLEGGAPAENYAYGQLQANVSAIKFKADELAKLKNGDVRPDESRVRQNHGIEEIRSSRRSDKANAERLKEMYSLTARTRHHVFFVLWGASTHRPLTVLTVS